MDDLIAQAKKEGKVTWYLSQLPAKNAEDVGKLFTAKYGIPVEVVRSTDGQIYDRLRQETDAKIYTADLLGIGEESRYAALAKDGLLAKYTPQGEAKLLQKFRGFDPNGYYHVTAVATVMIVYNPNLIKPADAPKSWADLLDPKYKGQIAIGHPGASAAVRDWLVQMRLLFGDSFLEKLAANKPLIGQSVVDPVVRVISGESPIGVTSDGAALVAKLGGKPIEFVYPTEGAVTYAGPSAVLAKAPHPSAARLLFEFLYSDEVIAYWQKTGSHIPMTGGKSTPPLPQLSDLKLIRPTLNDLNNGIAPVIEQFRKTMGV